MCKRIEQGFTENRRRILPEDLAVSSYDRLVLVRVSANEVKYRIYNLGQWAVNFLARSSGSGPRTDTLASHYLNTCSRDVLTWINRKENRRCLCGERLDSRLESNELKIDQSLDQVTALRWWSVVCFQRLVDEVHVKVVRIQVRYSVILCWTLLACANKPGE